MKIPCPVAEAAARAPDALAVVGSGERWTYRDLDAQVRRWCAALRSAGVEPGDRIGLRTGNRPAMVAQVHAIARLGAVAAPFNLRLTPAELAPQVELVTPRVILDETSAPQGRGEEGAAPLLDPEDSYAILFTSGTTGRAKAAVLTLGNFLANARASAENIGGASTDRWLACLPLFHVGGLAMVFRCAVYGAALFVHERFDPTAVNEAVDVHGITHVSLVATTLARTLEDRRGRRFPPSLKAILIGGGPVPPALLAQARALGAPVLQTYGLTEACSQVTTERPGEADGQTAGPPLPGVEVRIVDAQGGSVPPGAVGEIEVRGPTVMRGYFRDDSETHQTLWKTWLRTRDLGALDERGRLRVFARRSDLILSGGENVYPTEVEAALMALPGIVDAAVVGVEDAAWGQVPVAAVVTQASDEELARGCRERLAGFKIPRRFIRVTAIPRNAGGKVDRVALRALVEQTR